MLDIEKRREDAGEGGGQATSVPKSMISRLVTGFKYIRSGDTSWFGPSKPMAPSAPPSVEGRLFDFPFAYNMNSRPRANEPIGFAALRSMADNYDLLRIIIEGRKDQIAKLNWSIQPKDKAKKNEQRCKDATDFFMMPDKIHTWDDWLRMIVEDMLVTDAATLYIRKTNGGELYALEPMDGATIAVLIDAHGRRPIAPEPAYAQQLKGVTAVHYTADELIYKPRNPRTNRVYGYSPVEQVIMTVHTALRRQLSQFDFFESGTLPDAIAGVPESWTPANIKDFQEYFDNTLSGDSSKKRKVRYMPAESAKTFKEVKPPPLKDMFDEWLARVICYAFSVEATPFIAQVNRSVAETNREQSLQEGLVPLQRWVKSIVDFVLAKHLGWTDVEFQWDDEESIDPKTQAEVDQIYLTAGVITAQDIRKRIGMDDQEEVEDAEEVVVAAVPTDPNAPAPVVDPSAPPTEAGAGVPPVPGASSTGPNVQATALNGTQITSLMALVQSVVDEAMPLESVRAMISAAFPMLTPEQVEAMLAPTLVFEPVKPDPIMPFGEDGQPMPPPEEGEGGEPVEDDGKVVPIKGKKEAIPAKKAAGVPDIHLHVTMPEVVVDVAGTNVHLHQDAPGRQTVTKTITAERDPITGNLVGKITEESDNE